VLLLLEALLLQRTLLLLLGVWLQRGALVCGSSTRAVARALLVAQGFELCCHAF
jgi:hypothetical protein